MKVETFGDLVTTQFDSNVNIVHMLSHPNGSMAVVFNRKNFFFHFQDGEWTKMVGIESRWNSVDLMSEGILFFMYNHDSYSLRMYSWNIDKIPFVTWELETSGEFFFYSHRLLNDNIFTILENRICVILSWKDGTILYEHPLHHPITWCYDIRNGYQVCCSIGDNQMSILDCSVSPALENIVSVPIFGEDNIIRNFILIKGSQVVVLYWNSVRCFTYPAMELVWVHQRERMIYSIKIDPNDQYILISHHDVIDIASTWDGSLLYSKKLNASIALFFSRDSSKLLYGYKDHIDVLQLFYPQKQALQALFHSRLPIPTLMARILRAKLFVFESQHGK